MLETGDRLRLRPLTRADLPLLARWLAEPVVARWWPMDLSTAALEAEFGPALDGEDPTELMIAGAPAPFGFAQRYRLDATPQYVDDLRALVPVSPGALGLDYLIGEADARGRGLGAAMIAAAVREGWTAYRSAPEFIVPVAAGNRASWRSLERAGFTRVASGPLEPDNPIDPPDHVVYRIARPG